MQNHVRKITDIIKSYCTNQSGNDSGGEWTTVRLSGLVDGQIREVPGGCFHSCEEENDENGVMQRNHGISMAEEQTRKSKSEDYEAERTKAFEGEESIELRWEISVGVLVRRVVEIYNNRNNNKH
jgi:hypothetical protein